MINTRLKLLLKSNIITCKTHNQFTMIDLIFSSEKIQFMTCKCKIQINLHQKFNHLSIITKLCLQTISVQLLTWWFWKKIEYRSIECLSANTFILETLFRWQDYDEWQSVQDYQSATENHQEIYLLDKIIKLSKRLLKSKLLRSNNEIKTTANHMKNVRYIKSVKWISEA